MHSSRHICISRRTWHAHLHLLVSRRALWAWSLWARWSPTWIHGLRSFLCLLQGSEHKPVENAMSSISSCVTLDFRAACARRLYRLRPPLPRPLERLSSASRAPPLSAASFLSAVRFRTATSYFFLCALTSKKSPCSSTPGFPNFFSCTE